MSSQSHQATSPVMLAAFRLVRRYGAPHFAQVLGKSAQTVSNEVNPNYPTAKLGLDDALTMSVFANDREILNAWALEQSCMVLPLTAEVPGTEDIAPRTALAAREFADLMGALAGELADGDVSANDVALIEREAAELMRALQDVLSAVRAKHQAQHGGAVPPAPTLRAVGGDS